MENDSNIDIGDTLNLNELCELDGMLSCINILLLIDDSIFISECHIVFDLLFHLTVVT